MAILVCFGRSQMITGAMVEYNHANAGWSPGNVVVRKIALMSTILRDQFNVETPLTCPVCGGDLVETGIRTLGTITRNTAWEMHSGRCEEHGWFQAEIVGKPPRDIFAVTRPFGASRRLVVGDTEYYQFPTVWNDVDFETRMDKSNGIDPLDATYWKPKGLE